jgi:outer membrane protein assembly factor BamB
MTSKAKGQKSTALIAVESSLAAYDKYVFYADMGGVLRCVDTDTLHPVWAAATGDAVMAAVALDLTESRELNLYTANMYANRKKGKGEIQIRRYDALSGKEAWCTDIGVVKGKKEKADVGAKASPVIGEEKLKDLVFFTVTGLSEEGCDQLGVPGESKSALIALDKDTGKVQWAMGMESRTVSSPVAVYDKNGDGWIIQCAQDGNIYMVEGLSGAKTASLKLEAEVIASPAVYNNIMVIGTTGKGTSFIYGIEIRTLASAEDGEPEAVEAEPEEATKEMQEEPEGEAEPEEEAGAEEPAEDA